MKRTFIPSVDRLDRREMLSGIVGPVGSPPAIIKPWDPTPVPIEMVSMTATYNQGPNTVSLHMLTVGLNAPGTTGTVIVQYQLRNTLNGITFPAQSFVVPAKGLGNTPINATIPLPGYIPGPYTMTITAYSVTAPNVPIAKTELGFTIDTYVQPSDNPPVIA